MATHCHSTPAPSGGVQLAADGFRLSRRAGRQPGARRGRRRDRPQHCARRAPTWAPRTRPAGASGRSSTRPRRRPRGFLGCEPAGGDLRPEHDLAELHALAHRRPRTSPPATRSSSPRSTTTAASRRGSSSPRPRPARPARRARARHDARLRRPRAKLVRPHARRRVRLGVERDRHDRRRRSASAELAHDAGALAWIDAVHYAAHEPIDVRAIDADVLICSPYKFCGPHLGIAYGRARCSSLWRPYKARPAPTTPLGRRFETGTLPYELLAGFNATIDYLDVDRRDGGDRPLRALRSASASSRRSPESVTVYGLPTLEGRVPTFLLNVDGVPAARRRRPPRRARDRRLGARQLVLAEPLQAPRLRGRRDPRRLHPLQHAPKRSTASWTASASAAGR